jgi:hypothetical protein
MRDFTAVRFAGAVHELMQVKGGPGSEEAVGAIAYALGRVFADIPEMTPQRIVEIRGQLSTGLGVAALAHRSLSEKGMRPQ